RRFVLRRGNDGIDFARERKLDGGSRECERRAAGRRGGSAEIERSEIALRAVQHVDCVLRPVRVCAARDDVKCGGDSAKLRRTLEQGGIANDQRTAGGATRRVKRCFEADLRPDAGGVAGGDGDNSFVAHFLRAVLRSVARISLFAKSGLLRNYCQGI